MQQKVGVTEIEVGAGILAVQPQTLLQQAKGLLGFAAAQGQGAFGKPDAGIAGIQLLGPAEGHLGLVGVVAAQFSFGQ